MTSIAPRSSAGCLLLVGCQEQRRSLRHLTDLTLLFGCHLNNSDWDNPAWAEFVRGHVAALFVSTRKMKIFGQKILHQARTNLPRLLWWPGSFDVPISTTYDVKGVLAIYFQHFVFPLFIAFVVAERTANNIYDEG